MRKCNFVSYTFLPSVLSSHLLMCGNAVCSNAEIPLSSASSEDRSFRADIAASFQVILHSRDLASVCSSRRQGFYNFSWNSWFLCTFWQCFMQRVAVLHLEAKCERAIQWALKMEPSIQHLVTVNMSHTFFNLLLCWSVLFLGCHTHHLVLPSVGGFRRSSLKSVCEGSAGSDCEEKRPATCVPSPQPLHWQR